MNYMKTPLKEKKSKTNRRVISGGEPAKRKRDSLFKSGTSNYNGAPTYGKRKKAETASKKTLPAFSPGKVILVSILITISGLLYINHVFSTQQALIEVQQLQNEFNKTQRMYEEHRLVYDRMVGPKQIYQQAREQGFINAGPADQIIISEP